MPSIMDRPCPTIISALESSAVANPDFSSPESRELDKKVKEIAVSQLEEWSQLYNQELLSRFIHEAVELGRERKIKITRHEIHDWQSWEDPSWKQSILSLYVNAEAKKAMSFWEELSEVFEAYLGKNDLQPSERLRFSLSIEW